MKTEHAPYNMGWDGIHVQIASWRHCHDMEDKSERWYFTKEELYNTPSRTDGLDNEKELQYRQLTASFITEMGMKLNV